jgi:hypothetical protein
MKSALDAPAFAPGLDTSRPTEPAMAVIIRPVDSPTELMIKPQPGPARLQLHAAPGCHRPGRHRVPERSTAPAAQSGRMTARPRSLARSGSARRPRRWPPDSRCSPPPVAPRRADQAAISAPHPVVHLIQRPARPVTAAPEEQLTRDSWHVRTWRLAPRTLKPVRFTLNHATRMPGGRSLPPP